MQSIGLLLISLISPIIFITGFKFFKKSDQYSLRWITVVFIFIEIFKFFYMASLFEYALTPSEYLTFSVLTLLAVLAAFGAFSTNQKVSSNAKIIILLTAVVPLIIGLMNNANWYRPQDLAVNGTTNLGVISASYFIQAGLILTYAFLVLKEKMKIKLIDLIYPFIFVGLVLGLSALTNLAWDTNFIFNDTLIVNILIPVLSVISVIAVWGLTLLVHKKWGEA